MFFVEFKQGRKGAYVQAGRTLRLYPDKYRWGGEGAPKPQAGEVWLVTETYEDEFRGFGFIRPIVHAPIKGFHEAGLRYQRGAIYGYGGSHREMSVVWFKLEDGTYFIGITRSWAGTEYLFRITPDGIMDAVGEVSNKRLKVRFWDWMGHCGRWMTPREAIEKIKSDELTIYDLATIRELKRP